MGPGGRAAIPVNPINQGEVVLVPFPFTDLSGRKQRPAVVVSPRTFHPEDVVVCAVTSQVPAQLSPWEIPLTVNDIQGQRLPRPSVIRVGKVITLHSAIIRGRFGQVTPAKLQEVLGRLRTLFADPSDE